MRYRNTFFF